MKSTTTAPYILCVLVAYLTASSTAHALPWNDLIPPDNRLVVVANRRSYNFGAPVGLTMLHYLRSSQQDSRQGSGGGDDEYINDFFIASAELDVRCFLWGDEYAQSRIGGVSGDDGDGNDGDGDDDGDAVSDRLHSDSGSGSGSGAGFISPIIRRGDRLTATEEELGTGLGIEDARYNAFACYDVSQPYDTAVLAIEVAHATAKELLVIQIRLDETGAGRQDLLWLEDSPLLKFAVVESASDASCRIYSGRGGDGNDVGRALHEGAARVGEPVRGLPDLRRGEDEYSIVCETERRG